MMTDSHPPAAHAVAQIEPGAEASPPPPAQPTPAPRRATRLTRWLWGVALLALALFFALGSVPVEAGWFPGLRSDRVTAIWADYGDQLSGSRSGTSGREIALYTGLALFLLVSAAALWLALTAHDPEPQPTPDPEPRP